MRTTTTLFTLSLRFLLQAQTPGDTLAMYFDAPGESLQLDSIYPAGCWQVGAPSKTVFTSAFSPGKALVTDTLLPHPADTTCYAEFSLIATDWNYLGRHIYWEQQVDMDSLSSEGWLEFYDTGTLQWHRFSLGWDEWYQQGTPTWTDSGFVFTGSSNGWETIEAWSPCMLVLWEPGTRSTFEPNLRVRFVFKGGANPNGRDGWMIDNVRAAVEVCTGGLEEPGLGNVDVYPVPAMDRLVIAGDALLGVDLKIELLRSDGAVVASPLRIGTAGVEMNVSALAEGLYLLRLSSGDQMITRRIEVQR